MKVRSEKPQRDLCEDGLSSHLETWLEAWNSKASVFLAPILAVISLLPPCSVTNPLGIGIQRHRVKVQGRILASEKDGEW